MYYFCYWGKKILKGIQERIPLITLFILFICWANSFYSQTGWNPQIPYLWWFRLMEIYHNAALEFINFI